MSRSRQLAAIMFTDIVGFTSLMGSDEQKTFEILDKNRKIHKPIIHEFNGKWIKELGDGVMASFNTVSDAVNAAIKIQEACNAARDFKLRIGIHQGEVVFENDDVFGDGVNIAARIQSAAHPGSIFISESVNQNITNKKGVETQFVREEILKNVRQPIKMFQVLFDGSETILPEKKAGIVLGKSIAVLPFVNMSNDEEQEYFSDGITEEIINMLAQVTQLTVMGRTSSFAFKGKNMDLKLIGEALNVSYLLEGSVRRSGNTLRITAQLINVANGAHLYSEKFDRELKDIFDIQDEISEKILNAVKIKLLGEEKDTFLKKNTDNLEAHELYLKGVFQINKFTPDGFIKAIEYLDAAISLDTNYALAYAQLAFCYTNLLDFNWLASEESLPKAKIAARKSLQLDDKIFESHLNVGRILLHQEWNVRDAMAAFKKALAINPNSAETHVQLAVCLAQYDRREEAMEYAKIAESLDPISVLNLFYVGAIPFLCNNPQALLDTGEKLIELEPNFFSGYVWSGIGYGALEKYDEAIAELEISVKLNPGTWTLSLLGWTYGSCGNTLKAREVIDKIKAQEGYERFANAHLGNVYYAIGELDTAFKYYDRALEYHEGQLLYVKYTHRLYGHPMEDQRFKEFFDKMNVVY